MKKLGFGLALALGLMGGRAHGAVPAGYAGTPYLGTPWSLPGRIEFENYDEGTQDVVWRVDDHTGNFGVGGCAANNYRTALPHPQLCQTNTNPGEIDTFTMGPMMGMPYPSAAMPKSIYIGYTHGVDWVKLTVNVTQAGTYKLSSTWASEPGGADAIKFQVLFNDMLKADVKLPGTGGYHNWVAFPDFATVELEAGVQVLQFAVKSMHLNYDYLQFSRVLPGGGVDDGSGNPGGGGSGAGGAAGAAGAPGTSGAATGGGSGASTVGGTGGDASGGTQSAPSAGSGTGGSGSGSGTVTGAAGTATTAAAGTAPASAGAPATGAPQGLGTTGQDSGCSLASGGRGGSGLAALAALAACGVWGGRRARRLKRTR